MVLKEIAMLKNGYNVINGRQVFVFPRNAGGDNADEFFAERMGISPFFIGEVNKESIEQTVVAYRRCPNETFTAEELGKIQDGRVIFCEGIFVERMKAEHVLAILAHEEGHDINGDLDIKDENLLVSMENGLKILDSVEIEIAADAYAASIHGKETVARALLATFDLVPETLGECFGAPQEKIEMKKREIRSSPQAVARMTALGFAHLLSN